MARQKVESGDFIKFLGTAGARFVMIKQLRASGGVWLKYKNTNVIIDPGPGSLVRACSSRPKLDPGKLDAIILTHKHLDHSGDANVMIEAMTEGGFKKRGCLFVPEDALGCHGVIFSYLESFPEKIITLRPGRYSVGDIVFEVPRQNAHSVMTFGLKFRLNTGIVSIVSDTRFSPDLADVYADSNILVLNVVFYERREYEHLCLEDAVNLIKVIRPKKTVLTHFGMGMLKAKPYLIEQRLRKELGLDITCAHDGYTISFDSH